MPISGTTKPFEQLIKDIQRRSQSNINKQKYFKQYYEYLRARLTLRYWSKGALDGTMAWVPLKEKTVERKRKKGYYRPSYPLIGTGFMSVGWVPKFDDNGFEVYNKADYLKYHEQLTPGTGKLPARRSMFFTENDLNVAKDMLLKHLKM